MISFLLSIFYFYQKTKKSESVKGYPKETSDFFSYFQKIAILREAYLLLSSLRMQIHLDQLEALYSEDRCTTSEATSAVVLPQAELFSRGKFSFKKLMKTRSLLAEIKIFIIAFILVFSGFFFFTNAKLVLFTINDTFSSKTPTAAPIIAPREEHSSADLSREKEKKLNELEEKFASLQKDQRSEKQLAPTMKEFLDKKQETHTLDFNMLPPTNRLIIPDLDINVPLIDIPAKGGADFTKGNFDEELMKGVVKYPTTPTPWTIGNTLLFGHTSTERWKKNEYGFVFRNLPKLKEGQQFQVIWDGKLTTYEMVERKVVLPKQVADYYQEFQEKGKSYLTLMGCYPIGSDAKRMMVVAKKI